MPFSSKICRGKLSRLATALLITSALHTSTVNAAPTFQLRVPVQGLTASTTVQIKQIVTEILVALTGGPALPAGEVNTAYRYDLNQLLSVTGDATFSSAGVTWALPAGALPAGLSLGSDGIITGTPTTQDLTGNSFQVQATYKTKTGQQAYTIIVNGAVLHVTQISAGFGHTCAVTTTGGVKCWGLNNYGQLGDGSQLTRLTPVAVSGLSSGVTSIAVGGYHNCAVTTNGGVKCWGFNTSGQLGDSSTVRKPTPVDVTNLASGIASISAGWTHTCAVTTSGGAKCWGYNGFGQLGNNTTSNSLAPVDVTNLTANVRSVAGGLNHTCAVTTGGAVMCWGSNSSGSLGNKSFTDSKLPVSVFGLASGVLSLTTGGGHTCALTTGGGVKCWGLGTAGQLGNNSLTTSNMPVDVSGLTSGVTSVGGGGYHTCAVTTNGGAKCWGDGSSGQLGNNSVAVSKVPVDVMGVTGVSQIIGAPNGSHTCALTAQGPKCWGYNANGQLGDGTQTNKSTPVDVLP